MSTDPLLSTADLSKRLGGLLVTDNVSFTVEAGEFHAVIGPNGAGKSTLINQIGGQLSPDAGRVLFDGTDITALSAPQRARLGISRVFQVPRLFASFTVTENPAISLLGLTAHVYRFWRPLNAMDEVMAEARQALEFVGIEDRQQQRASELSHGDRRLLEMAVALASRPKLLLLDEPMAGLGRDESLRMAGLLGKFKGSTTIVMVEHDMDTVFSLADSVTVLAAGRIIASGLPEAVRADSAVRTSYLGEDDDV
jgi:branched-chain amino acid transport system ATP-binding protein